MQKQNCFLGHQNTDVDYHFSRPEMLCCRRKHLPCAAAVQVAYVFKLRRLFFLPKNISVNGTFSIAFLQILTEGINDPGGATENALKKESKTKGGLTRLLCFAKESIKTLSAILTSNSQVNTRKLFFFRLMENLGDSISFRTHLTDGKMYVVTLDNNFG